MFLQFNFDIICSFLEIKDIYNLEITSKTIKNLYTTDFWKFLGENQNIEGNICCKYDYEINSNPLIVKESELFDSINENEWCKKWNYKKRINRNGTEDHIYKAYVKSIMKLMIQVKKHRLFFKNLQEKKSQDWKISVNIQINDLLKQSEKYRDEIYEYDKLNNYFLL